MVTKSDNQMDAAIDSSRESGPWEDALATLREWDPTWAETCAKMTTNFMATGATIYASGLMSPKLIELLSIAFDASYTHMYAPGTRRHIKAALEVGATMEEVMEVLLRTPDVDRVNRAGQSVKHY